MSRRGTRFGQDGKDNAGWREEGARLAVGKRREGWDQEPLREEFGLGGFESRESRSKPQEREKLSCGNSNLASHSIEHASERGSSLLYSTASLLVLLTCSCT